jgi:hypothetical protein
MSTELDKKRQWVIDYLLENTEASALNQDFHEKFHNQFGGARAEKYWGAQPVRSAMSILSGLAKTGVCETRTVSLGGAWQPGFPRRVRSYCLSQFGKKTYAVQP